jgi:hypothetical protein
MTTYSALTTVGRACRHLPGPMEAAAVQIGAVAIIACPLSLFV